MIINEKFKNNWKKIIDFNSKANVVEDIKDLKEIVRIPLTPINLEANILYYLFEIIYPRFITDQQNILDLIISEEDIRNKTIGLYLYPTQKAGIHEKIEKLPIDTIKIKEKDLEDFDELFTNLQKTIWKRKGIRISSFRLFKTNAIKLINTYSEPIETLSNYEFIKRFLDLIQDLIENNLFCIYPEPNVYRLLKNFIILLNGIKLSKIFELLNEFTPVFNLLFILNSNNLVLASQIQKRITKPNISEILIKVDKIDEFRVKNDPSNIYNIMIEKKSEFKVDNVIYLNQNDIISFFSELSDLEIPLNKDNVNLIIQKFLYGYRRFEDRWNIAPRPTIYNIFRRFIFRLFGFNLNLKKISHWTIPELLSNSINIYFGLNSKILVFLTNIQNYKNLNLKTIDYLKVASENIFLLEIENSSLTKIIPIKKSNLLSGKIESPELIRSKISETYGFISSILIIDKYLLMKVLELFVFKLTKFSPIKKLKVLKLFKQKSYFNMYPELPIYRLFNQKRITSFLRLILPILIDKHEF
ncbi:MAG: hypothetical protein ACFE8L_13400 [Candidatus Hodarchaeota archaeon]